MNLSLKTEDDFTDGYRRPTIEEFVDGFGFEVYSDGFEDTIEDFCGWYEYKMGGNNWRSLSDIQYELKEDNIRCYESK